MSSFGRKTLDQTGRPIQAAVDHSTEWKSGGITIDWDTVTAVATDTTLADGTVVKAGDKYLRYGMVLTKITASGKYGPADTAAVDGRQTLTRGEVFVLNQTKLASGLASDHQGVIEGGRVYEARVPFGTAIEGATQPAKADVLAVMPRLVLASD